MTAQLIMPMFAAVNWDPLLMRAAWSIGSSLPFILLLLLTKRSRYYPLVWLLVSAFAVGGDMVLLFKLFASGTHSSSGGPVAPFGGFLWLVLVVSSFAAVPTTLYAFTWGRPGKRNDCSS